MYDYIEVFKMSNLIPLHDILLLIFPLASIYMIILSLKQRLRKNIGLLLFGVGLMIFSTFLIYAELYLNIIDIYIPYNKKEYKVVEGEVKNLHLVKKFGSHDVDRFMVGNKKFSYHGIEVFGPYERRARDGGFIRKEGQHVKIYYIPIEYQGETENHIVRLFVDSKELEELKAENRKK